MFWGLLLAQRGFARDFVFTIHPLISLWWCHVWSEPVKAPHWFHLGWSLGLDQMHSEWPKSGEPRVTLLQVLLWVSPTNSVKQPRFCHVLKKPPAREIGRIQITLNEESVELKKEQADRHFHMQFVKAYLNTQRVGRIDFILSWSTSWTAIAIMKHRRGPWNPY